MFAVRCRNELTIRDISHEAGCNSALISYYFGSKENLYSEVVAQQFRLFEEAILAEFETDGTVETVLRNVCAAYFRFHTTNPHYLRLLGRELASPTSCYDDIVKPCIAQIAQKGIEIVQKGIKQGDIDASIDPTFVPLSIAALSNYFFFSQRLAEDINTVPTERVKDYEHFATALLLRGLGVNQPVVQRTNTTKEETV